MEAECIALAVEIEEEVWLKMIFEKLGVQAFGPVTSCVIKKSC